MGRIATLGALMVLGLSGLPLRAVSAAEGGDTGREVNGHTFQPTDLLPQPFCTTHVGLSTGFGFATLSTPAVDEDGYATGGTAHYRLAALAEWLDLQLAPLEWLAVRGKVQGNVLSGADPDAALTFGANVGLEYALGTTVRVFRARWLQAAVSLDVDRNHGYRFSPSDAIVASLQAGRIDANTLLTRSTETDLLLMGQVAVAPTAAFGAWLAGGYARAWTSSEGQTSNEGLYGAGLGASLDFAPLAQVPVGLVAAYLWQKSSTGGASATHNVSAGVFYTGRRNLALGLEAGYMLQSPVADVDLSVVTAQIRLRYYW